MTSERLGEFVRASEHRRPSRAAPPRSLLGTGALRFGQEVEGGVSANEQPAAARSGGRLCAAGEFVPAHLLELVCCLEQHRLAVVKPVGVVLAIFDELLQLRFRLGQLRVGLEGRDARRERGGARARQCAPRNAHGAEDVRLELFLEVFVAHFFHRRDDGDAGPRHVWRAYSIASAAYDDFLEFYSIVVPDGEFTTRLAGLKVGDELLIEKTSYGFLTTDRFPSGEQLWLLSSGTGLAPFMSILQDLTVWTTYRKIVVVHSVRTPDELAYRADIERYARQGGPIPNTPDAIAALSYVPIVTRVLIDGCLQARIPAAIRDGSLETAAGLRLDPGPGRAMLCGNPEMVEDVRAALQARGFAVSRRSHPGNMAIENYW